MSLGQKQRLFTRLVGLLIEYAYQNGYEPTFGDDLLPQYHAIKPK